jgi:hypothetical protein
MVSAGQILQVVARYLSQEDAEKFTLEFSALSYNIHKNGDAEAIDLANKIESKMADLHGKFITSSDFSDFLRALVNPFVMNISVPVLISTAGPITFAAGVGTAFQAWAGFFGTSSAAESELKRR